MSGAPPGEAPASGEDVSAAVAAAETLLVSEDDAKRVEGAGCVEKLAADPRCVLVFTFSSRPMSKQGTQPTDPDILTSHVPTEMTSRLLNRKCSRHSSR